MYKLSRELLEYLADHLQVGKMTPNYDVRVYKKVGEGKFDNSPIRFKSDGEEQREVASIDIDRRWNMSADEAQVQISNINGVYSPDYNTKKEFDGIDKLYPSGYQGSLTAFNKTEIDLGYGDQLVRMFTGQLQPVEIQENPPTITFAAKNVVRKLLKPIDPVWSRTLKYENKRATEIIADLCKRAGVESIVIDAEEIGGYDYSIEKAVFEIGTTYKDAINTILETMGHRLFGDRDGTLVVKKLESYTQKDFHHWEFNDYINLSSGSYKIDPSVLRNRIIVQSKHSWKAYEDPYLIKFCNGEKIPMSVEIPWAETDEQKWMVANNFFLQMRRKLRRITVAVIGNPSMDIGDLAKLKMLTSTANDKYMIVGIRSTFSDSGYFDIVDLEFVTKDGKIAVEAEGDYSIDEDDEDDISMLGYTTRDKIVDEAKQWLGTYYQWGGDCAHNSNHYGMDCSHFTYTVYKKFGLMSGYMTAAGQYNWSKKINKSQLKRGDLVFYTNSSGRVCHVGIYIGNNKVISASGGDSSTNTLGKARQRNAKVKIHALGYRQGPIYFGKAPGV